MKKTLNVNLIRLLLVMALIALCILLTINWIYGLPIVIILLIIFLIKCFKRG